MKELFSLWYRRVRMNASNLPYDLISVGTDDRLYIKRRFGDPWWVLLSERKVVSVTRSKRDESLLVVGSDARVWRLPFPTAPWIHQSQFPKVRVVVETELDTWYLDLRGRLFRIPVNTDRVHQTFPNDAWTSIGTGPDDTVVAVDSTARARLLFRSTEASEPFRGEYLDLAYLGDGGYLGIDPTGAVVYLNHPSANPIRLRNDTVTLDSDEDPVGVPVRVSGLSHGKNIATLRATP